MKDVSGKSTLSLAILGLLSQKPASGYDLRRIFSATPMGHFSTSPGAVYPALRRLEKGGLIKGRLDKRNTLRPKLTYTLTKKGMGSLKEMLDRPVTGEEVKWRLDELLLRFAFMGKLLGKKKTLDFLREFKQCLSGHIRNLREHLETRRKDMPLTGAYALEYGVMSYRATLRWVEQVEKDLKKL